MAAKPIIRQAFTPETQARATAAAAKSWSERDPTRPHTRDSVGYSDAESAFLRELQRWKDARGIVFPTAVEILHVAIAMGYRLVPPNPTDGDPACAPSPRS